MKRVYGYAESSTKSQWEYFDDKFKYPSFAEIRDKEYVDIGNIHIRYISYCNKKDMIEIIGSKINNKNWVRQRISETSNNFELDLSKKYLDKITVYVNEGILKGTIIAFINLNTREIKNVESE